MSASPRTSGATPARPRITFVNRFAYPDDSPTSRLLHDVAVHLAVERPELSVRVLASNRLYSGLAAELPRRESLGGIEFVRLWSPAGSRRGLLLRALSYSAFYLQGLLRLLLTLRRGELLVCMSDPPLFNLLATLAASLRGAKVVQWIQDLYPDVVQSAGLLGGSPLLPAIRALRAAAFRRAARLVVVGEGMRERLLRADPSSSIEVIPNWADGSSITPRPREALPLAQRWVPPGSRFVLGYFGNLGFAHNFHSSLQAAARLVGSPEIQFLWVGDGSRRVAFQQEIGRLGLGNVHWQGQQPFERMAEILGIADLHLVMLDPQFDEVLVPSKTYSALAAGRPLLFLGNPGSELARLVREQDVGVVVAQEDVEGYVTAVRSLAAQPARCREMGLKARALFESRFERSSAMGRWLALVDEITGGKNAPN